MTKHDGLRHAMMAGAAAGLFAAFSGVATAGIISTATPAGLDLLMGTPLLAVPDDGMPIGSVYGHPPSSTPGSPLATPIGLMGFGPSHERITAGTATSSGAFLALTTVGPIAGSTVYAPAGANAIDLFISSAPGSAHSFEITAVGTSTSTTIVLPGVVGPTYVGFGAFGESIVALSIVNLPFPTPTTVTWIVEDIRVLPGTGTGAIVCLAGMVAARRRRR